MYFRGSNDILVILSVGIQWEDLWNFYLIWNPWVWAFKILDGFGPNPNPNDFKSSKQKIWIWTLKSKSLAPNPPHPNRPLVISNLIHLVESDGKLFAVLEVYKDQSPIHVFKLLPKLQSTKEMKSCKMVWSRVRSLGNGMLRTYQSRRVFLRTCSGKRNG